MCTYGLPPLLSAANLCSELLLRALACQACSPLCSAPTEWPDTASSASRTGTDDDDDERDKEEGGERHVCMHGVTHGIMNSMRIPYWSPKASSGRRKAWFVKFITATFHWNVGRLHRCAGCGVCGGRLCGIHQSRGGIHYTRHNTVLYCSINHLILCRSKPFVHVHRPTWASSSKAGSDRGGPLSTSWFRSSRKRLL